MGRDQGRNMKAKVQSALRILSNLEAFNLQKPPLLPSLAYRRLAEHRATKFLNLGAGNRLPGSLERLRGIADGAEAPVRSIMLVNAMEAVLSDLSRTTSNGVNAGCSAVSMTREATKDGSPIVAHNFDYIDEIKPLYAVRRNAPQNKLQSLEFTAAPLSGCVDGINEAGLSITCNYAYAVDRGTPAPTITMWISEAMGSCRTVSEAVELFESGSRWGGGLLMMADANGDIASLEISNTRTALRRPDTESNWLQHTNRFQTDSMGEVEIDSDACYSKKAPSALRGIPVHRSAISRDCTLQELIQEHAPHDQNSVARIMSDHGPDESPSNCSVCMHSEYWQTTASVQLLPAERKMRIAFDNTCRAEFTDLIV